MKNKESVRNIIIEKLLPRLTLLGLTAADVNDSQSLTQTGVLDSFAFLMFVSELEEEFKKEVDFSEMDPGEFTSVSALTNLFS